MFLQSLFTNNTIVLCVCNTGEMAVREKERLQHRHCVDVGGSFFHRIRRVAEDDGSTTVQFWANTSKSIDGFKAEFYIQGLVAVVEQ